MALTDFFVIFLSQLLLPKCQLSYPCRNFTLEFPFTDSRVPQCGLYVVHGCNDTTYHHPIVDIGHRKSHYSILGKPAANQFLIHDAELQTASDSGACYSFANTPPLSSPSVSFAFASPNITVFPCFNKSANENIRRHFKAYNRTDCEISTVYYETPAERAPPTVRWDASFPCAVSHVPIKPELSSGDLFDMVAPDYILEWRVAHACYECHFRRGGRCVTVNWNEFYCRTEFGSCIMKSCKTQFKVNRSVFLHTSCNKESNKVEAANQIGYSFVEGNQAMALLLFLFLYHLHLLLLFPNLAASKCPESFQCGHHFSLEFPFSQDPQCGIFNVSSCNDSGFPVFQIERSLYHIIEKISTNKFKVLDFFLSDFLRERKCFPPFNVSLPQNPSISFTISSNLTSFFTCNNQTPDHYIQHYFQNYRSFYNKDCGPSTLYYLNTTDSPVTEESNIPTDCGKIQFPIDYSKGNSSGMLELLSAEFTLEWNVSEACYECYHGGGQCVHNSRNEFRCKKGNSQLKLILGICIPVAAVLLLLIAAYIWQRKKKLGGIYLLPRNISSDPSSRSDIEDGSFNFGIPIFSYSELVEATNNFDSSKELGDGGFGTVYYGKLQDGREVAIKRLYEHNYKRVEQFLNEIQILTSLRHPNLVSLYGCTSRRSRELLLVYEYIPNGTVADHLHGERAKEAPLTWPVRMSIARETAAALAYLHKSVIIHRDVKTNNILLDNNFSVKVADFGLSRLFPTDVTHISTAPQGTPGYVDPEYHQCYQLTDKSDVYSFGVVLIELISSMTAVDISRHKHEINLANLAVNKIQKCAFDELIDPSTGYNSDPEVTRMTTSVAELAFRCLQLEKDLRPRMEEVVVLLKDIQDGHDCNFEQMKEGNGNHNFGKIPPSPETDEAVLLKSKNYQSSPTAVTDAWISSCSTTASSVG